MFRELIKNELILVQLIINVKDNDMFSRDTVIVIRAPLLFSLFTLF